MKAVYKRELKAYFNTPLGFVVLAAYYLILGIFYYEYLYLNGSPEISVLIIAMYSIVEFTVPIITMRLLSEERRNKTDQVLLTAPVSLTGIVMGKFLAAFTLYAIAFAPTVIFEIISASYVSVNILSYLYSLFGILLMGAAFISVGMFVSSLTESPVVSAFMMYVVVFIVSVSGNLASAVTKRSTSSTSGLVNLANKFLNVLITCVQKFLSAINIEERITSFAEPVFSVPNVIYFLSASAVFLFLSVRSLEKRRWA